MEDYQQGVSVVRLAKKYGIHKTTVSAHLRRAGVPTRGSVGALNPTQVKQAAELYEKQQLTLADLGEHFSVSPSTIRNALDRACVVIRSKGRPASS